MKKGPRKKPITVVEPRVNDEIRGYTDVRIVYTDEEGGKKSEVVPLRRAKDIANEMQLDLVEINGNISPPILRVIDYSKYLFELKKQEKAKRNQKTQEVKEIQLSANISDHDMEVKLKKAREFIKAGHKVKVVLKLRGRELSRREEFKRSLLVFIDKMEGYASPESMPKDEGNRSIIILRKRK